MKNSERMQKTRTDSLRYSFTGFLLGLLFPLSGFLITYAFSAGPVSLLVIISSAPLVMAAGGFFIGRNRDLLKEANAELEFAVTQRTSSIRSMLDISGQAVFTFDSSFLVLPEHSTVCREFFGKEIAGEDVRRLLFEQPDDREDFAQGIQLLFDQKAQPQVVFDLFESERLINGRLSQIVYRFIPPDRILVGLTDITESKSLSLQLVQEERNKEMVFTAVSHQNYFRDLLRDAEELFFQLDSIIASGSQEIPRIQKLQRHLHTFKGNCSFFHFSNTHELVDELETYIGDMLSLEEPVDFRGQGLALKRIYFQELRKIVDTLGEDWLQGVDAVRVPRRQFQQLLRYIEDHYKGDEKLTSSLRGFYKVPFRSLFSQYPHLARGIAARLGKRLEEVEIEGGDFPVLPDRYRELSGTSVHLIRNMIDHGIEAPWERAELGKAEAGSVNIRISHQNRDISIRFADDGRGIDYSKVAQRAISRGLLSDGNNASRGELIKLLFRSGFSTSESADSISGRGVGLSAVKAAVKKLGGTISVKTQDTKGTVFTIRIPYKDEDS